MVTILKILQKILIFFKQPIEKEIILMATDTLTTVLNDVSLIEKPLTIALDLFGKSAIASTIVADLTDFTNTATQLQLLANPNFTQVEQIIEPELEKVITQLLPGKSQVIIAYIKVAIAWEAKIKSYLSSL